MKTSTFFKKEILVWLALLAPFVLIAIRWNDFPERIPTHWNIHNEVDDWSDKIPSLLVFPGINLLLYALMLVLPKFDPKRMNYERFAKAYFSIRLALHYFFAGVVIVMLMAALGYEINMGRIVVTGCCLLFLVLGNVMGTVKHNYFVGIRTPWTLNDEDIWNRTHRLAARVWVICSLLLILPALLLPLPWMAGVFFAGILVMVLVPVIYSYRLFKKKNPVAGK
ncbi:MAG: putative integral membrane protein [Bacteroidetes bacterium]|nr:MAG: putative integral membrane protein [Bacteroidota bacterium]